jgi:hypothetical protein
LLPIKEGPQTRTQHAQDRFTMIKTLSLSVMFFLTLGLMFAAYASVPV